MRILAAVAVCLACSSSSSMPSPRPATLTVCQQAAAELLRAQDQQTQGYLLRALDTSARARRQCPTLEASAQRRALTAELALPPAQKPTTEAQRSASLLYRDGVRLRIDNKPAQATRRLEQSYSLAPHPLTQLQLAEAARAAAHPIAARKHIARAVHLAESRAGARLRPLLASGHGGSVTALALSPRGRTLYSGADDGVVIAWDMSNGRERWRTPVRRQHKIHTISLSPDGRRLALSCNQRVYLLDTVHGHLQAELGAAAAAADDLGNDGARRAHSRVQARSVLYLDDHRLAVGMNDGSIEVWRDGKRSVTLAAPARTPVLALTPSIDRTHFIAGWSNGYAATYRADDLHELWRLRTPYPVRALALAREAKRAYVALWDGSVAVYDAAGETVARLRVWKDGLYALALFDDGRKLAAGVHGDALRIIDTETGAVLHQIKQRSSVRAIATMNHGETAAIADGTGEISAANLITGKATRPMSRGGTSPFAALFHPGGTHMALRLDDGATMLWDLATGKPRRLKAKHHQAWALAFSPSGKFLVTVAREGELILWRTDTGASVRRFGDREAELLSVTWSGDSTRIYTGDEHGRVAIWDPSKGTRLDRFEVHKRWITTIAVSPDGATLATGSLDSEVALTTLATQKVRHRLRHYAELHGARFTGDGSRIVTAGFDGVLRVFDVGTGQLLSKLHTETSHSGLAVTADGAAYAAGADRRIHGIEIANGTAIPGFGDHDDRTLSVDVHPTKPLVVTGAFDRTARLWHRETRALLAILTIADDGSWVIVTPDARVDGSVENGRTPLLMWRAGPYQLPSWAGWQRGHRPGLLAQIVGEL